ncbi:unnamed protein product [Cylicocyclus nassatus]|uniref:Uncharacterized protein n=1 Tax=Cylicocyclus nassatus TaxID=53992 RepID=A0AA36HEN0_CYLNA|nr:unnamed protein product [Cylicocyclus nassatus]
MRRNQTNSRYLCLLVWILFTIQRLFSPSFAPKPVRTFVVNTNAALHSINANVEPSSGVCTFPANSQFPDRFILWAIENGHDVNQRDLEKRTPLFIAVGMKRLDICRALVERGEAIINANCGSECNTALHIAVSQESEEIVKYLLSKGASKTIRNIRQQTPSQLAQSRSPLRSLVEKYRSYPRQLVVPRLPDVHIVCFPKKVKASLTFAEQAALERIMTVVPICDEETTHYVVALDTEGVFLQLGN